MNSVKLKEAPELKRVIVAGFPGYKKHTAFFGAFHESGVNINSYWSGGSKDEYAIVHLETMSRRPLPTSTHPFFDVVTKGLASKEDANLVSDHVGNIVLKHLPDGFALVRAGWFCGKPATAFVYFNQANLAKVLQGGTT